MTQVNCKPFQTILKSCQESGIMINDVCGGNGICKKCKVTVLKGEVPPSKRDLSFFTKEEIEKGLRLACHAVPQTECVIELSDVEEEMEIVSEGVMIKGEESLLNADDVSMEANVLTKKEAKVIVVDIGTTTLVIQLCNIKNGESKVLSSYAAKNRQSRFGADVISRIQASMEGKKEELKECIREQIKEGIRHVLTTVCTKRTTMEDVLIQTETQAREDAFMQFEGYAETQMQSDDINHILITGNTTMVHLIMGYNCETLGCAPFTPVTTEGISMDGAELFLDECILKNSNVYIFPGISAFVGGDIISGLYAVDFIKSDKIQIFLDLGTNGEMAIGNKDKILTASAAAGPAFEGGNIACGMASIKGAVTKAILREDDTWKLTTIQDETPIGICGSGLIEIIHELYKHGKIDETGLLCDGEVDALMLCDGVYITQQDIRMFQMAKAAICAGLETLIKEYGITEEVVDKVWIAGGFANYLDIEKATKTGLFPAAFQTKITCAGNTALAGLQKYAIKNYPETDLLRIKQKATEVSLAGNNYFEERLIENMYI